MAGAISDEIEKVEKTVRAEEAKHDVTESYDALRRDVTELASSVKRLAEAEFGTAASDARAAAERQIGEVEGAIRKNPTQAALIAAGAGFVLGLLISR